MFLRLGSSGNKVRMRYRRSSSNSGKNILLQRNIQGQ